MAERIPQDIEKAAQGIMDRFHAIVTLRPDSYGRFRKAIIDELLAERQATVDRVRSEDCGDDRCTCCKGAVARAENKPADDGQGLDADDIAEVRHG